MLFPGFTRTRHGWRAAAHRRRRARPAVRLGCTADMAGCSCSLRVNARGLADATPFCLSRLSALRQPWRLEFDMGSPRALVLYIPPFSNSPCPRVSQSDPRGRPWPHEYPIPRDCGAAARPCGARASTPEPVKPPPRRSTRMSGVLMSGSILLTRRAPVNSLS
jgi:hypothetical protein